MYPHGRKQLPLPEHLNFTTSRYVGLANSDPADRGRSKKYKKDAPSEDERETVFHRPFPKSKEYEELVATRTPDFTSNFYETRIPKARRAIARDPKYPPWQTKETPPYSDGLLDHMSLALQEAYADEILQTAPQAWADAATQTPGTVHRKKGKTGVTKGIVKRKALDRTNPRRAAAEADLKEIETRRRTERDGHGYTAAGLRQDFDMNMLPRAKDIAQYFQDASEGKDSEYIDAATAYAMGDMRRSQKDKAGHNRTQFNALEFQDAAVMAGELMGQRFEAFWHGRPSTEHAQGGTAPMRRNSATAIRGKTQPKPVPKKKAGSAGALGRNSQGKRSWASTEYATTASNRSDVSIPSTNYASASSSAAQRKARRFLPK